MTEDELYRLLEVKLRYISIDENGMKDCFRQDRLKAGFANVMVESWNYLLPEASSNTEMQEWHRTFIEFANDGDNPSIEQIESFYETVCKVAQKIKEQSEQM